MKAARVVGLTLALPLLLSADFDHQPPVPWLPPAFKQQGVACELPRAATIIEGFDSERVRHEWPRLENYFGASTVHHSGDGGESVSWRCWLAANGDGTVLAVEAYEMGHGSISVIGNEVPFAGREHCARSRRVHRQLGADVGIRLGMSRKQIDKYLGPVASGPNGVVQRTCEGRQPMTETQAATLHVSGKDAYFDVGESFAGILKNGKLVAFRVARNEST